MQLLDLSAKVSLLWFVPQNQFELHTPEEALATYSSTSTRFSTRFCKTCWNPRVRPRHDAERRAMAAVNIRSLEDFDLDSVPGEAL